jgi:hypothetical protein
MGNEEGRKNLILVLGERRVWKMVGSLAPLAEGLGGTRRFWLRIAAKAANSPNNTARLCLLSNLAV